MKILDMTGKPCPMPVVEAKKVLSEHGSVRVLVDNSVAVQNLTRLADSLGGQAETAVDGSNFAVAITGVRLQKAETGTAASCGPTVLITADQMGRGSEELGSILIKGYIFSLTQLSPAPAVVYLLNAGVKLAAQGANTVPDLQALAAGGTAIFCCGTCLNYYNLSDKLAVGQPTDMMGISAALAAADRVITL